MNKNALMIGGIVLAVIVTLPLALGKSGDAGGGGVSRDWRDYQVPEYAERLGLNMVRRELLQSAPWTSYEAVVAHLHGVEGVEVTTRKDLTPLEYHASYDDMVECAESPESQLYLWVNEWDCPMVLAFKDGEAYMLFDGVHPDTKYF